MRARLAELKQDYEHGECRLQGLLQQEAVLRESLLRVSGAIRILEELLAADRCAVDGENPSTGGEHGSQPTTAATTS